MTTHRHIFLLDQSSLELLLGKHLGEEMRHLAGLEIFLEALQATRLECGRAICSEILLLLLRLFLSLEVMPFVNSKAGWYVSNIDVAVIVRPTSLLIWHIARMNLMLLDAFLQKREPRVENEETSMSSKSSDPFNSSMKRNSARDLTFANITGN